MTFWGTQRQRLQSTRDSKTQHFQTVQRRNIIFLELKSSTLRMGYVIANTQRFVPQLHDDVLCDSILIASPLWLHHRRCDRSEYGILIACCWPLFITITKSAVIILRYVSTVIKHKRLGLSPSTFMHFDSLDWGTAINDNDTDITREKIYNMHWNRHTLQLLLRNSIQWIGRQWLNRWEWMEWCWERTECICKRQRQSVRVDWAE